MVTEWSNSDEAGTGTGRRLSRLVGTLAEEITAPRLSGSSSRFWAPRFLSVAASSGRCGSKPRSKGIGGTSVIVSRELLN